MIDNSAAADRCETVLVYTSELRNTVTRLRQADAEAPHRRAVVLASRALEAVLLEPGLEPLRRCGTVLQRLSRLWETRGGPTDSFTVAAGVIERSVDGLAYDLPAAKLDALYDALRSAVPVAWQKALDLDDTTFAAQVESGGAPRASAGGSEAMLSPEQALQRELRATFVAEADEAFALCEGLLVQLEQRPDDREILDALFRQLHTLKGSAAAVDLPEAAAQLHSGESLLQATRDGTTMVDGVALVDFLLRLADSVRGLIDRHCGHADSPYAVIEDVEHDIAALSAAPAAQTPASGIGQTATDSKPRPDPIILGSQLHALAELRDGLGRGEGAGDIRKFIDALDQQARQFWDLASELKEQVDSLILVPLEQLYRRLQRPARDAARQEGKLVTLELSGGATRVDRSIAERLHAPLLHLVRNAVTHGIELPETRERRGKHRTGTVGVHAEARARDLVLVVEDDGNGLDLAAIRAAAAARGWLDAHEAADRQALLRMILRSGFSTRRDVSELAGRGVGMDVVAREVEALHGTITIES